MVHPRVTEIASAGRGSTGVKTGITTTASMVVDRADREAGVMIRNTGAENLLLGFSASEVHYLLEPDEWLIIPCLGQVWVENEAGVAGALCYMEC